TAARMVVGDPEGGGRPELSVGIALALVAVGVVAGTTAGLLGVGGGVVMVPAMVVLVGMPAAVAKGSSLAVIIPTAIVGTRSNLRKRNAEVRTAAVVGLSGLVSSFLASQLSVGLDERLSNRLFAGLLVVMAARMLWENRRAPASRRVRATAEAGPGRAGLRRRRPPACCGPRARRGEAARAGPGPRPTRVRAARGRRRRPRRRPRLPRPRPPAGRSPR